MEEMTFSDVDGDFSDVKSFQSFSRIFYTYLLAHRIVQLAQMHDK
jgi:hypothetical protein